MSILDVRSIDQLQEMIGGDRNELNNLIELYLLESREILSHMDVALETRDLELLRRSSHSLKSSSQDFGAIRLSELSASLESSCRNQWPDSSDKLIKKIRESFEQVDKALNDYVSGQNQP